MLVSLVVKSYGCSMVFSHTGATAEEEEEEEEAADETPVILPSEYASRRWKRDASPCQNSKLRGSMQ